MSKGTITDKLISFALPLMLSGMMQLTLNAVEIVVIGQFSGKQSLAAVGATTALINRFLVQGWRKRIELHEAGHHAGCYKD